MLVAQNTCIKCNESWYENIEYMIWTKIDIENIKVFGQLYCICSKCSEDGKCYSVKFSQ